MDSSGSLDRYSREPSAMERSAGSIADLKQVVAAAIAAR